MDSGSMSKHEVKSIKEHRDVALDPIPIPALRTSTKQHLDSTHSHGRNFGPIQNDPISNRNVTLEPLVHRPNPIDAFQSQDDAIPPRH